MSVMSLGPRPGAEFTGFAYGRPGTSCTLTTCAGLRTIQRASTLVPPPPNENASMAAPSLIAFQICLAWSPEGSPSTLTSQLGSVLIVMRTSMGCLPNQFPGVHDARRVQFGLDRLERGDAPRPDLALEVGRVVAADRVVVGQRATVGDDRLAGGLLGRGPLLDLVSALLPGEEREVQRAAGRVEVRDVAPHDRRGATGAQRVAQRARHRV